jgi:cell wall-associated NlpC family hydrolase
MTMDKEKLNALAMTFIGTPHVNGGNIKGVGLDCSTLPAQFFHELGYGDFEIMFGYSGDWYCKKDCEEKLLPYLEKYGQRITEAELQPGDVISYRWGRAQYAHLSIYLGDNRVLHCQALTGVEITDANAPYFFDKKGESRITGYWRAVHQ